MRSGQIRFLLFLFAAIFLVQNATASARACTVRLAAQEHTAIRMLGSGADKYPCPDANRGANCLAHFAQSHKSDGQNLSFYASVVAVAPPRFLYRVWFPVEPGPIVIASAPPVVGPPLTILFGNLRN